MFMVAVGVATVDVIIVAFEVGHRRQPWPSLAQDEQPQWVRRKGLSYLLGALQQLTWSGDGDNFDCGRDKWLGGDHWEPKGH